MRYFTSSKGECPKDCFQFDLSELKYIKPFAEYTSLNFNTIEASRPRGSNIHHKVIVNFQKLLKEKNKQIQDHFAAYKENLRTKIINNFFEKIHEWVMKEETTLLYSFHINFQNINTLRDSENKIQNIGVSKASAVIKHFINNVNYEPKVKSLNFIGDSYGVVLFSDYPKDGSSLFHFNFSDSKNIIFEKISTFSTKESCILTEPNQLLWCVYSNESRRLSLGKFNKQGRLDDGGVFDIFSQQTKDGSIIQHINSACFLPFSDIIFILNQDLDLFEYKYQSGELNLVYKKENRGGDSVSKSKIVPTNSDQKYLEVQTTYNGKYVLLRSKDHIDIYDLNWHRVHSINIDDKFISFKVFFDKYDNLIIIFTTSGIQCYQLIGMNTTTLLKTKMIENDEEVNTGNPILDYLYLAFTKFGPHSSFIGAPSKTKLIFVNNGQKLKKENMECYFKTLKLHDVSLKIYNGCEELRKKKLANQSVCEMSAERIKMLLFSRVPLHIATIENFNLNPLQDGKNISDHFIESILRGKGCDSLGQMIGMIKLGGYERLLKGSDRQVSVISIVGRQSSGKSYVMNRLFGTRFDVSSRRCTDGIWMSVCETSINTHDSKLIIVLDCEGTVLYKA